MVLTLDKITNEVCRRVGDRNKERYDEVRRYVQSTVTDLTKMLRKGSVFASATLSVSGGIATLPADVVTVLKIYDTGNVFFESVGNDEYRRREINTSTMPTVQVFEDVPYWRIKLLNYTDSTNTINVDYLLVSKDPAILPDYYFELIATGSEYKYHLRHSPQEKQQGIGNEFKMLKNEFNEQQAYNDPKILRMKGLEEIYLTDPNNSLAIGSANNYISPGGYY